VGGEDSVGAARGLRDGSGLEHDSGHGRGRSLSFPQFPDDDGSAHPVVRDLLARAATGRVDVRQVARALRGSRLLATVVAVLDEMDEAGGDKDSHMAVVSMVNDAGEKGLLAFTGVDSVAHWNPEARPVPAFGRDIARAAKEDGALAVVLDVAGPARVVLDGVALEILADELDLDRVSALLLAALAPLTADGWLEVEVFDGRSLDAQADVLVQISSVGGGHPDGRLLDDLARQAARTLAARPDIQRQAPGGIGVILA
jgi:hypothetical protein